MTKNFKKLAEAFEPLADKFNGDEGFALTHKSNHMWIPFTSRPLIFQIEFHIPSKTMRIYFNYKESVIVNKAELDGKILRLYVEGEELIWNLSITRYSPTRIDFDWLLRGKI